MLNLASAALSSRPSIQSQLRVKGKKRLSKTSFYDIITTTGGERRPVSLNGRAEEKIDIGVQFEAKLQRPSRKMIEKAKGWLSTLSSVPHPASSRDTGVNMATAETAGQRQPWTAATHQSTESASAMMMMLFCPNTT